jgi:hypothetical protein
MTSWKPPTVLPFIDAAEATARAEIGKLAEIYGARSHYDISETNLHKMLTLLFYAGVSFQRQWDREHPT